MKLVIALFSILALIACNNDGGGKKGTGDSKGGTDMEKPLNLSASQWTVVSKSCDATPVPLAGAEKIQFPDAETFATLGVSSVTNDAICEEQRVYSRYITAFAHGDPGMYNEQAQLQVAVGRFTCRSKFDGHIVSKDETQYSAHSQVLIFKIKGTEATASLTGLRECLNDKMNYVLKRD